MASPVRDLLAGLPRIDGNGFCFPASRDHAHATYRQTRTVFARACDAAGLADARPHDLRRSFLTMLAGAGANAFQLRDVAGHASLAMADRYVRESGVAVTAEQGATLALERMTGGPVKTQ